MGGGIVTTTASGFPRGSWKDRLWLAQYRRQAGAETDEDTAILEGRAARWGSNSVSAPSDLADIAARFEGGEVDGDFIHALGPNGPLQFRVDPAALDWFFVYAHSEPTLAAAKAFVRQGLKLVELDPAEAEANRARNKAFALDIWNASRAASGSIVEAYLREARGIRFAVPDRLRFHPRLRHAPTGKFFCSMVGLVTDVDDQPCAIHRTYLATDGRDKAAVGDSAKWSLGPVSGGAIRLAPFDPSRELMIGEGVETCLSAMIDGGQAWSAVSSENLKKSLRLPAEARDIVLLADNDPAGDAAVLSAYARWHAEGRRVRVARPPPEYNDFNDLLRGRTTGMES
jgi:hypothetical protein